MLRELSDEHPLRFRISDGHEGKRGAGWCEAAGIDWALPLRTGGCFPAWNHRSAVFSSISIPEKAQIGKMERRFIRLPQDWAAVRSAFFLPLAFLPLPAGGSGAGGAEAGRGGAGFAMVWE